MKQKDNGMLVWITGLPGSGKTTLANAVYKKIGLVIPAIHIDGDHFRAIMGNDLGHSMKDRLENAYRITRLNKHLTDQGITVICSTVSLFREIHRWNRKNHKKLMEIYIDTPMDILMRRDQKGMYTGAAKKQVKNVRGFDQGFDMPQKPDMIIRNTGSLKNFLLHTEKIVRTIKRRNISHEKKTRK